MLYLLIGKFDLQKIDKFVLRLSDCDSTSGNSTLCITKSTVVHQHNVQADHQQVENNRNTLNSSRNSALDSATGNEIHVLGPRDSLKKEMSCTDRNFLVFLCSERQVCGGWGDRQKGIISTYLLAMLMNRTFSMMIDKPCDISQFLVPSEYNWRLCHEYIQTIPQTKERYSSISHLLSCNGLADCSTQKVLFINTNVIRIQKIIKHPDAAKRIPWAINKTVPEVSKIVLARLFRPSDVLETATLKFTNNLTDGQSLICSHVRTGKNPTMPNDFDRQFDVQNVNAIFNFLKNYNDSGKYIIYIATDDVKIRQKAKTIFTNSLAINLPIVHVDKVRQDQEGAACKGLFAVLLEQSILSRCDLFLLTRSNMGAMAAYMSTKQQTLFIFYNENRTIFEVSVNQIQTYFKFV